MQGLNSHKINFQYCYLPAQKHEETNSFKVLEKNLISIYILSYEKYINTYFTNYTVKLSIIKEKK